jgi:hypothetical protein
MSGIADFPAAAGRLLIDRGGSRHTTSSIDNRQSAIGNENLVFGCGYAALCALWLVLYSRPTKKLTACDTDVNTYIDII